MIPDANVQKILKFYAMFKNNLIPRVGFNGWYSDYATDCTTQKPWFDFRRGQEIVNIPKAFTPTPGPTQTTSQRVPGALSGVK
jgi:hypothetical protein